MIAIEVEIDAEPVRAMDTARALRDQLRELGVAESVELAREAAGHDAGAKSEGDMLVLATVVLELLPVGAQAAIDWLADYVRRPGTSPVQIKVKLKSGASAEARFDPKIMDREEIAGTVAALKSELER